MIFIIYEVIYQHIQKMDNMFKDLYQKENLTFDEILVMLNNNYDPDKKLLLKLMEYFANKNHKLYEYVTFCNLLPKIIDKYGDIKDNCQYLEYAYKYKNIEIIELLIINNARLPYFNLSYFCNLDGSCISNLLNKIKEQIHKYKDEKIEIIVNDIDLINYKNVNEIYNLLNECKNSTDVIKVLISCIASKKIDVKYKLYEFLKSIKNSDKKLFSTMSLDIKKIMDSGLCNQLVIDLIKEQIDKYKDEKIEIITKQIDLIKYKNVNEIYNLLNECKNSTDVIKVLISCIATQNLNIRDHILYEFIQSIKKSDKELFITISPEIKKIMDSGLCNQLFIDLIKEQLDKYKDKSLEIIANKLSDAKYENVNEIYNLLNECKNSTDVIKVLMSCISSKKLSICIYTICKFLQSIKNTDEELFNTISPDIKKITDSKPCNESVIELIKHKIIPLNDFVFGVETPLTYLIKNHGDISELKNCGIDFNLKNKLGETPFNIAIKQSYICDFPETTLKMLNLGCNPYIKDNDNKDGIDILFSRLGNYYREQYVYKAINIIKGYKFKN